MNRFLMRFLGIVLFGSVILCTGTAILRHSDDWLAYAVAPLMASAILISASEHVKE